MRVAIALLVPLTVFGFCRAVIGAGPTQPQAQAAPVAVSGRAATTTASTESPDVPAQDDSLISDMQTIMVLLRNHDKVSYIVKFIPGGARTTTTSKDPVMAASLQMHAAEMKRRMDRGFNIRPTDPLFQELFRRHTAISIKIRNVKNGVIEEETSLDPQVAILIRAHTHAVAGFVRFGLPSARETSPLPKDYHERGPIPVNN